MSCTERCNCCESGGGHTPLERINRAGLDAIAYRVGTFSSFRASMLDRIAGTPGLSELNTRESDDYAITVLEGWAAVADVLTFYQERYAQELFLRTGVFRDSVLRLARMIGYELHPGSAATALLALEASEKVTIPEGLLVQSVPDDDTPSPQKFETLEVLTAWPALNAVPAVGVPEGVNPLAKGSTWAWLEPGPTGAAAAADLSPGDRLVIFDSTASEASEASETSEASEAFEAVEVESVERVGGRALILSLGDRLVNFDSTASEASEASEASAASAASEAVEVESVERVGGRALIRWSRPVLGTGWSAQSEVYRAGERYGLFGANAPSRYAEPSSNANIAETTWTWTPTDFDLSSNTEVTLDGVVEDIEVGDLLLVARPGGRATGRVTLLEESKAEFGPLSGSATKVTFDRNVGLSNVDLREVRITKLLGERVRFWAMRYPETVPSGTALIPGERTAPETIRISDAFDGTELVEGSAIEVEQIEVGRRLMLGDDAGAIVSGQVTAATVVRDEPEIVATTDDGATALELGFVEGETAILSGVASGEIGTGPIDPDAPLSAASARLLVRVGESAVEVALAQTLTVEQIAAAIEAALRGAGDEDALADAIAVVIDERLVILAGDDTDVSVEPAAADSTTFTDLGFDGQQRLTALAGAVPASAAPDPSATAPELAVSFGALDAVVVSGLDPASMTLENRATELQSAINDADPAPLFAWARVVVHDGRFVVVGGTIGAPREHYLRIDYDPDGDGAELDGASAILRANVAKASHGESVTQETLGSGDGTTPFLAFELAGSPVTHLSTGAGVETTLIVRVDGEEWTRVDTFYGATETDRVYRAVLADDETTTVVFGDGVTGVIPPSGVGNIVAEYRAGIGLDGRVNEETLRTLRTKPTGLDAATNPNPADGGADPQALDDARANAPATVRTFGRAVSLMDYEDLVQESGEVAKALVTPVWRRDRRAVHLTVGAQGGDLFSDASLESIMGGLAEASDPNHELSIDNYTPVPIVVHATLAVDADYVVDDVVAEAHQALADALAYDARSLGEPIPLSDVYVVLHDLTSVSSVHVTRLMFRQDEDVSDAQFDAFLDDRGVVRDAAGAAVSAQTRLRIYPARADNLTGSVTPAELAVVSDISRDIVITGGHARDLT